MAAMVWSYAAVPGIELDPAVVFRRDGYKGDSASSLENFRCYGGWGHVRE